MKSKSIDTNSSLKMNIDEFIDHAKKEKYKDLKQKQR